MLTTEKLESLAGAKILVAGDIMLDQYIHAEAYRISAEAPVPVFKHSNTTEALGGAGNVVRNLTAMGAEVRFAGMVGNDPIGQRVKMLLADELGRVPGGDPFTLFVKLNSVTTLKTRLVSQGQQVCRLDVEDNLKLDSNTHTAALAWMQKQVAWADAIVISDYNKGFLTNPMIRLLTTCGKPAIVNAKTGLDRYQNARVIILNQLEASIEFGPADPSPETLLHAIYGFMGERIHLGGVVLTLGEDGLAVVDGINHEHVRAHMIEVRDVTGAGDSVTAAVAVAMARGHPLVDAARLGNRAGAVAVTHHGCYAVSLDDLISHMRDADARKIAFDLKDAAQAARLWHGQNKRVGLISGVFDCLHPGHIDILRAARTRCDKLIVALNADLSANTIKGKGSPIQGASERAAVLSALSDVDLVVRFPEITPIEVVKAIRPEVLVRGSDHQEADEISEWVVDSGGDFHVIPLTRGYSAAA